MQVAEAVFAVIGMIATAFVVLVGLAVRYARRLRKRAEARGVPPVA